MSKSFTIFCDKRCFKNEINTQTLDFFHCEELYTILQTEIRGVRGVNPSEVFASSVLQHQSPPLVQLMVIHAYFLTKADELHSQQHRARGFTEFPARGQRRASSAQSLPASEPLEAALPPPNSFLSLLQHPRVPAVHVKPQPAPGL